MSETTASLWTIEAPETPRPTLRGLLAGLVAGALIGAALTALATGSAHDAIRQEAQVASREWPSRPLADEWRVRPTPVDVDRMFRKHR